MTAVKEISAAREPIGIGKASTINFEIFEKCEYRFNISFFRKKEFQKNLNKYFIAMFWKALKVSYYATRGI